MPVRRGEALQPANLFEHLVEAEPGDELHGVIVQTIVLAHAEDRNDVGVVQSGRGPGFALEPPDLLRRPGHARGDHLEGHMPAE